MINALNVWTAIGSGFATMIMCGLMCYGALVLPFRRKLEEKDAIIEEQKKALTEAITEIQAIRDARFSERLQAMEQRLTEIEGAAFERKEARQHEHQTIKDFVREAINRSDAESRVARKSIHEDIARCQTNITRVESDLKNAIGWLEKLDERFDAQTKELVAAVAKTSGIMEASRG